MKGKNNNLIILISISVAYNNIVLGEQQKSSEVIEEMDIIPSFYLVDNLEQKKDVDFSNAKTICNVLGFETVYKVIGDSAALGTAYYYFIKNADASYELLCSAYAMDVSEVDINSDRMAEIVADVYCVSPNIYIYTNQNGNIVYADLQESSGADYIEFHEQTGIFLSHIKVNGEEHTYRLNLVINN